MRIVEDIEKGITNGLYVPGKKIPSVRELSNKYNCSKNTIIKAYDTLKNNHIIYSTPKSGYYIVENINKSSEYKSDTINFYSGNTIIGDMNTPDLKHILNWAGDLYRHNSIDSGVNGVDSLKYALIKYLANFQVFTNTNNIYINMGIIQALNLLIKTPFPNSKKTILLEQPSYGYFIENLKLLDVPVIGIERDYNGIDLVKLEKLFKEGDIKFFYTIPRHHNPLGTTLNKSQRKSIARLASKYDVYIVEDDYFSDVDTNYKYDPIFSYSDYQHVIYLKSYSKIMPWMRVGIVVLPNCLIDLFNDTIYKNNFNSYFSASLLSQATLEIYIRSKILNKHSEVITNDLKEKYKSLLNGLKSLEETGAKVTDEHTGFYSYIQLPEDVNENILIKELENKKVIVGPGERCFYDKSFYKKGIRLSIASVDKDDIQKGMEIIKETILNLKGSYM
ncbi:PLP-dependent aminotransferase family protein [Clostridium paraputrificum]|uniref:aminotransferase-like domain-containing protein n=1 Tax=Clostridium TaxID=1485 RepID=UPI003D33AE9F